MQFINHMKGILVGAAALWAVMGSCLAQGQTTPNNSNGGSAGASDQQAQATDLANKRGQNHVDQFTGSFGYSIPIACAPARNHSEPSLALSYSSGGGNGWCGYGWNLSVGSIERNTKDGFPMAYSPTPASGAPVAQLNYYDDSKGFFLNLFGKEYKLFSTFTNGSVVEYHAEVDTEFLRCLLDTANNYWQVIDTAGTIYYFGQRSDGTSKVVNSKPGWGTGGSGAETATFYWGMDKIDTATGDETTITYQTFTDPANSLPEKTIYPDTITYNSHVNLNGYSGAYPGTHTITFTIDPKVRSDYRFSYAWGFRTEQNRVLTNIVCSVGGQKVWQYGLSYTPSPATGRYLLASVTPSGFDSGNNASPLPTQNFTYQGSSGIAFSPTFHWTGLNLTVPGTSGSTAQYMPAITTVNQSGGFSYGIADLVDMDGDGLPDRVYCDTTVQPNQYYVQHNNGNGTFGTPYHFGPVSTATASMTAAQAQTASDSPFNPLPDKSGFAELNTPCGRIRDINGDGLPDRVMDDYKPFSTTLNSTGFLPYTNFAVMLNTGTGFSAEAPWTVTNVLLPTDVHASLYYCVESGGVNVGFFDINGDGLPDRVMSQYYMNAPMTNLVVQFNTGTNFTAPKLFPYKSQNFNGSVSGQANPFNLAGIEAPDSHVLDLNGDGLPDHIMWPINSSGAELSHPVTAWPVEFNDGYSYEAISTSAGVPGSADQWTGVVDPGNINYAGTPYWGDAIDEPPFAGLFDVNGDGLPDRVVVDPTSFNTSTSRWLVYLNNGHGFNTTPITVQGVENQGHYSSTMDLAWWSMQASDPNSGNVITTMMDINGDGMLDRVMTVVNNAISVSGAPANYYTYFLVQTNMEVYPDLLTNINNGMGGITAIAYNPSTVYDNRTDPTSATSGSRMPFPRYVVSTVTDSDGVNTPRTTKYGCGGGFYNGPRREFAGFAVVTNTDPTLRQTVTYYHTGGGRNYASLGEYQDVNPTSGAGNFAKAGMAYRTEEYGNDSLLYNVTVNQIDEMNLGFGRWFPFISQRFDCDYPGTSGGTPRVKGSTFTYSKYNTTDTTPTYVLTQKILWGEVSSPNLTSIVTPTDLVPADTQYHEISYAVITGNNNIKDHPATVKLTSDSAGNNIVQLTSYTYNSNSGTLATEQKQICAGSYAIKNYNSYSIYGLPTLMTDPVGVVTEITYDSAYNIYPATAHQRVNPNSDSSSDLITTTAYDACSGELTDKTDPMGVHVHNTYDQFRRLTKSDKTPYGSTTAIWMKEVTYNIGGMASGVSANYVDTTANDGVGGVESRTYSDGFGRPIQTRIQGEAGNYRVITTAYDGRGKAFLTTWPRFETSVGFTVPTAQPASFIGYDAAGRENLKYRRVNATFNGTGAVATYPADLGDSGSPLAGNKCPMSMARTRGGRFIPMRITVCVVINSTRLAVTT